MGLYDSFFLVIESLCYCSFLIVLVRLLQMYIRLLVKNVYIHMLSSLLLPKPNEVDISASLKDEKKKYSMISLDLCWQR